jgi:hypothetical protein
MRKAKIYDGDILNGVVIENLLHVDGDVLLDRERLPNFAVIVAAQGTRLHSVRGIEGELDLGWIKLIGASNSFSGLPEYDGADLEGTVWLKVRYGCILVVSEELWKTQWEKIRKYLVSTGMAYPTNWAADYGITLGGDPEFEAYVDGYVVPACNLSIFKEGSFYGRIGTDDAAAIAELRPAPAHYPEEYLENFMFLVEKVWDEGILLSVKGDHYALGGHIHVGSIFKEVVEILKDKVEEFILVLDDFVGRVLLPTSGAARGMYKCLGAYEPKKYGWEYRTPPSSFYADPEMVRITYKLAKGLVETLLRQGELCYETLEDGRAREEEYYRFLTKEETDYFLAFPQRWARGEIPPFVPVKSLAVVEAAE